MVKLNKKSLIIASIVSMQIAVSSKFASAAAFGGVSTLLDWGSCSSDNEILCLVATILDWLSVGVVVAVLGGIVYGGVMYATSGGNESQAKRGIDIIRNAVIALVLYGLMYAILQFLIPGGLFS